jgi:hypothetical protein
MSLHKRITRITIAAAAPGYLGTTVQTTVRYHAGSRSSVNLAGGASTSAPAGYSGIPVPSGVPTASGAAMFTNKFHDDFMLGCTSSGQGQGACECLYQQLRANKNLQTPSALVTFFQKLMYSIITRNPTTAPASARQIVFACATKLRMSGG